MRKIKTLTAAEASILAAAAYRANLGRGGDLTIGLKSGLAKKLSMAMASPPSGKPSPTTKIASEIRKWAEK